MSQVSYLLAWLTIPTFILLHLYVSPFTKVEESFNIQATHDILNYGIPLKDAAWKIGSQYDHMKFPGAVPRTFVGAIGLAGLSQPFLAWSDSIDKQMLVRSVLGFLSAGALLSFAYNVQVTFGRTAAAWYLFLQASQFHVIYYASRPLPNTFAFTISTIALGLTLPRPISRKQLSARYKMSLYLLTIAGVIFRSEVALLLFSYVARLWILGQVSLRGELIPAGIAGILIGLAITVPVDTFFWQAEKPLWPELAAFLSNVFPQEGSAGASAWGISPWHWYFTSAIPRLLLNPLALPLIFACLAIPSATSAALLNGLPNLLFISLYSILPHKETRFIMYCVPVFTLISALSATYIWNRRNKTFVYRLLALTIATSTFATAILSHAVLLPLSSLNYPGGHALQLLHRLAMNDTDIPSMRVVNVHLDNLSTQTGVTRLQQMPKPHDATVPHWIYDKSEDEDLKLTPGFWNRFDYVIVEDVSRVIGSWDVVGRVRGLGGVQVLRPGQEHVKSESNIKEVRGTEEVVREMYGEQIARGWRTLVEQGVRDLAPMKGWWAEIFLEDKLFILKKAAGVKV